MPATTRPIPAAIATNGISFSAVLNAPVAIAAVVIPVATFASHQAFRARRTLLIPIATCISLKAVFMAKIAATTCAIAVAFLIKNVAKLTTSVVRVFQSTDSMAAFSCAPITGIRFLNSVTMP